MKSKRDQIDIIVDMLEVIDEGMGSKSGIMKNANLSNTITEKYINILKNKGLIDYVDGRYVVTEKGKNILQRLRKLRELEVEIAELFNSVSKELS
ncbi:winged helix-turn-helix domain-containing protein [Acidianus brierleyi]|uniref:Transcriptional regulator n=1 Tax=Acidianus brierleyi TaxID=41673 RepID=A0A2U9IGB7_9CREN|nr:winged helix-turn-helix domain-containing protein [Acidianus brierleyi]AWR95102.1 transcriptional regulator [Acidianus brierleyi]